MSIRRSIRVVARLLGDLYAETLFYEDIVDRASKRIGVYRDKLRIDFTRM